MFADQPYLTVFTFAGDNRTFAVAMALSASDPLRTHLQEADVHDRVLAAIPAMADWMTRAQFISDVYVMAGLSNRHRRHVADGRVIAPGLVLVGDAALYTNPTLGQGVSLGFWMAQVLADLLERVVSDPVRATLAHADWIDTELGPRFRRQVTADRRTHRQFEVGVAGLGFLPPDDDDGRHRQGLLRLAGRDAQVGLLLARVGNLLERPAELDAPDLRAATEELLDEDPGPQPTVDLTRSEFEHLVTP